MNRVIGFIKSVIVLALGVTSVIYLIMPNLGIFELIPDAIPFIGNLDEAAAVALLLNCLRYFGVDLTRFFARNPAPNPEDATTKPPSE